MTTLDTELALPIRVEDQLEGALCLGTKRNNEYFSADDVAMLRRLCGSIALVLSNIRLHQSMIEKERQISHSQKLAALGTMASAITHDLRNPLAVMQNLAYLIDREADNPDMVKNLALQLREQIKYGVNITNDTLDFSRAKTGQRQSVDLRDVAQKACDVLAPKAKKLRVSIDIQGNSEPVLADPSQIQQVLVNLLLNAIEAKPDSSVTVLITHGTISIRDQGSGIPPADLEKIWEPFYTTKEGGTGLGLSITKKLVEDNGGKISVRNHGAGAEFTISFRQG